MLENLILGNKDKLIKTLVGNLHDKESTGIEGKADILLTEKEGKIIIVFVKYELVENELKITQIGKTKSL